MCFGPSLQINTEYNSIDEGETIARTFSDYWVVCRKSGHRRFFILLNQKNANFAEINGKLKFLVLTGHCKTFVLGSSTNTVKAFKPMSLLTLAGFSLHMSFHSM